MSRVLKWIGIGLGGLIVIAAIVVGGLYLRTGRTPSGREMNAEFMPWESFAKMTDEELRAIWAYLGSLPALETTAK